MLNILLTVLCFSGFVHAASVWLKIKPSHSPLFCISFIGIFLYLFALSGHLRMGAFLLMGSGGILSICLLIDMLKKRDKESGRLLAGSLSIFIVLIIISFLLTINMGFTVIDDYVYWGIMGKYLYLHDHLPMTGNPLDERILGYTPGTALIHYFFNFLSGEYSSDVSYFAQNVILISALFVVVRKEKIKDSIIHIGILIALLTIFFGSVFTKLQVDYLLAIISFSIFWIYCSQKNIYKKLLTISMPLCFLFLIKEIGFVIGGSILIIVFFDILMDCFIVKKDKIKTVAIIFLIGGFIFLLKKIWFNHVSAMGFVEFHNAINLESIKRTLHIFSDNQVRDGFVIVIKDVFFGPADRLNIPYLFWYIITIFLSYKIFKSLPMERQPQFSVFFGFVFVSFLLYMFLLYCMQILIFGVGGSSNHTVGFARYLNIIFSPIVFIAMSTFFHSVFLKNCNVRLSACVVFSILVAVVLSASRIEVYLHREKQDIQIERVSDQIVRQINGGEHSIGIINGKRDGLANLQLLYYLLPNRVDYRARKFLNEKNVVNYILQYDYVLLYKPGTMIYEWLMPYLEKNDTLAEISFLRIHKDTGGGKEKRLMLEKVPLEKEF